MSGVQLDVGDVVKLKSGGPQMTVCEVLGDVGEEEKHRDVGCMWFSGQEIKSGSFPEAALERQLKDSKATQGQW